MGLCGFPNPAQEGMGLWLGLSKFGLQHCKEGFPFEDGRDEGVVIMTLTKMVTGGMRVMVV